ncbi:predicted protein [Sclerotinia sclerotiorum 1980 UF-70]|uniref:Uncharacterized protein n=1 Tax=Sclerotinia sclerotiorum (strain ATCC 18683 / 1980 / Ss-1) TaxID=665079 RepID=A7ECV5_SCLS1|nr:predicted protein [Sclerotinia sclerotiorum 1980 UF-70]EDO00671.1 predicted protein [Sclerotinia sclerotiorum 1980 UF-70]
MTSCKRMQEVLKHNFPLGDILPTPSLLDVMA